jgi:ABC-type nickel/cobalt efflux system permease component RcnA
MIDLDPLFAPVEHLDEWLSSLFEGAPIAVALGVAFLLGLRHATDPDHLMAVTALVARDQSGTRSAARLGAVWGAGHATALLLIGLPLILIGTALPPVLESTAETAVGVVIILLALRVLVRWVHRNREHDHDGPLRTPKEAFGIGLLHGLAGTGAVVLLLIAALPNPLEASAALAVFAPMSAVSMAVCTSGFAWTLTRPAVMPVYRTVLMPALGAMGLLFGLAYVGVA